MFDISNTKSWLGFAQKHIRNIIEEIVFRNCNFLLFSETISSIMFQICFWANPSQDMVFEVSKIIKTLIIGRFQGMYWRAHKTATLTSNQHIVGLPTQLFFST